MRCVRETVRPTLFPLGGGKNFPPLRTADFDDGFMPVRIVLVDVSSGRLGWHSSDARPVTRPMTTKSSEFHPVSELGILIFCSLACCMLFHHRAPAGWKRLAVCWLEFVASIPSRRAQDPPLSSKGHQARYTQA